MPRHPLSVLLTHALDTLEGLEVSGSSARIVDGEAGPVLELEGMARLPNLSLEDASVEVEVFAPAPCYPGIFFRSAGRDSFELAYAVPAASGQPDAIQYDPVFHGSNTWQLHTGGAYQRRALVPMGEWFKLHVDFAGRRAVVHVGPNPPLVIMRLSHEPRRGGLGLWSYRPARLRNLLVTSPRLIANLTGQEPEAPSGTVDVWQLEGAGIVACEANGALNLNRHLPASASEALLRRDFSLMHACDLEIAFGFSDRLLLKLDGETLFEGTHRFRGFETLQARGWVDSGDHRLIQRMQAGRHRLEARLRAEEPFGWGLIVRLIACGLSLEPLGNAETTD